MLQNLHNACPHKSYHKIRSNIAHDRLISKLICYFESSHSDKLMTHKIHNKMVYKMKCMELGPNEIDFTPSKCKSQ